MFKLTKEEKDYISRYKEMGYKDMASALDDYKRKNGTLKTNYRAREEKEIGLIWYILAAFFGAIAGLFTGVMKRK